MRIRLVASSARSTWVEPPKSLVSAGVKVALVAAILLLIMILPVVRRRRAQAFQEA